MESSRYCTNKSYTQVIWGAHIDPKDTSNCASDIFHVRKDHAGLLCFHACAFFFRVCVCMYFFRVCVFFCVCVCVCVCVYVCLWIYMHQYMHTHSRRRTHAHMHTRTHTYMQTYMHAYSFLAGRRCSYARRAPTRPQHRARAHCTDET